MTIVDCCCSSHPFRIIAACLSMMVALQNDPNNCCSAHFLPVLSRNWIARWPNRHSMDFDMEIDIVVVVVVGFDIDFGIGFDTGWGKCKCFVAEQLEHL